MVIKGKIGTQSFSTRQVLVGEGKIAVLLLAAAQGVLKAGKLIALDAAELGVPYNTPTEAIGTGDASTTNFTTTLALPKVAPGTVSVTDGTVTLTDDESGRLFGAGGSGTINYVSGDIDVTFTAAPANAASIDVTYANRVEGVLLEDIDTATDTAAQVIVEGNVDQAILKVGPTDRTVTASERRALRLIDIHVNN